MAKPPEVKNGPETGTLPGVDEGAAKAAADKARAEQNRAEQERQQTAPGQVRPLSAPTPNGAMVQLVEFTQPTKIDLVGLLSLKPGTNEVPAAKWEEARNHPVIQLYLRQRIITEGKRAENLAALDELDAYRAITTCNDVGTLTRWQAQETRARMKAAIGEQVSKLRAAMEDAKRAAEQERGTK